MIFIRSLETCPCSQPFNCTNTATWSFTMSCSRKVSLCFYSKILGMETQIKKIIFILILSCTSIKKVIYFLNIKLKVTFKKLHELFLKAVVESCCIVIQTYRYNNIILLYHYNITFQIIFYITLFIINFNYATYVHNIVYTLSTFYVKY